MSLSSAMPPVGGPEAPTASHAYFKRFVKEGVMLQKLSLEKDGIWVDPASINRDTLPDGGTTDNARGSAANVSSSSSSRRPAKPPRSDAAPRTLACWHAYLQGPLLSVWRAGVFRVEISILEGYPLRPPRLKFRDPIFHPNVHPKSGEICLRVLSDGWSPAFRVEQVLQWLRSILANPTFSSTDLTKFGGTGSGRSGADKADDVQSLLRDQEALIGANTLPPKLYHYTTREAIDKIRDSQFLKASTTGARGPGVYTTCLHPTNRTKQQIQQNNSCRGADYVVELDTQVLKNEGHLIGKCNKGYSIADGDHYLITKGEGSMRVLRGAAPTPLVSSVRGSSRAASAAPAAAPAARMDVVQGVKVNGVCMDIKLRPGVNCEITTFEDACTCVYNEAAHKAFCAVGGEEYRRGVRKTIVEYGRWLVGGNHGSAGGAGRPAAVVHDPERPGSAGCGDGAVHRLQRIGDVDLPEVVALRARHCAVAPIGSESETMNDHVGPAHGGDPDAIAMKSLPCSVGDPKALQAMFRASLALYRDTIFDPEEELRGGVTASEWLKVLEQHMGIGMGASLARAWATWYGGTGTGTAAATGPDKEIGTDRGTGPGLIGTSGKTTMKRKLNEVDPPAAAAHSAAAAPTASGGSTKRVRANDDDDDDDDEALRRALELSVQTMSAEDTDLQRAIELSKASASSEMAALDFDEDADLQRALQLSVCDTRHVFSSTGAGDADIDRAIQLSLRPESYDPEGVQDSRRAGGAPAGNGEGEVTANENIIDLCLSGEEEQMVSQG